MRFEHWRRLLAGGGYAITLNRLPNILGVTLMTPVSWALHNLSEAIFRRSAEAVRIRPPIFVLGHWRTGTTFLHNLLAADPANAFPTTFECTFPDGFLLTERALGWALALFLPRKRPMDDVPLGRDLPSEDEFALAKIGLGSPYLGLASPRNQASGSRYLDLVDLSDAERRAWEEGFVWLMQRFQLAHPGQRLVLKSPPHTSRVGTLLKLFPQARFIHIARNPFDVYPSTYRLWKILNSRFGLRNPADDDGMLPEYILSTLPRMYAAYERDRHLIPAGRLAEIRYEDLVADPKGTLRAVYGQLDLGDFTPVGVGIDSLLANLGEHRRSIHAVGEADRRSIVDRWGFYFRRFGYRHLVPAEPQ
jgi:hypothetical protein